MSEPRKRLLEDDVEAAPALKVNRAFAKEYQQRKQRQLLAKRKDLEEALDSEESESESEDENGEALDLRTDATIMKVINAIRQKDPRIYRDEEEWFSEEDSEEEPTEKEAKKMAYKDVMRERLLQDGAQAEIEEETAAGAEGATPRKVSQLMYDAEQRELRRAFLTGEDDEAPAAEAEDEEGEEDLFRVKRWAPRDDPKEEAVLFREIDAFKAAEQDEADIFLSNYISQRRWREGSMDEAEPDTRTAAPNGTDKDFHVRIIGAGPVSDAEDEGDLEAAETFESRYNFRFEEAGGTSIQTHARRVGTSVRREDDRRRKTREARKERKAAAKLAREEELKRLKNEKARALRARLASIAEIAGVKRRGGLGMEGGDAGVDDDVGDGDAFDDEDAEAEMAELKRLGITPEMLEADWDEDQFNAQMAQAFDEGYYEHQDDAFDPRARALALPEEAELGVDGDGNMEEEDEEGVEDEDEDEAGDEDGDGDEEAGEAATGDADGERVGGAATNAAEDRWWAGGDGGDADGDDEDDDDDDEDEEEDGGGRGARRKGRLSRALEAKIEDELYKLDYEDTIGSGRDLIKCRFKYTSVAPNDFGLSNEELLLAEDRELAGLVSLKKLAPYREDGEWKVASSKRSRWRQQMRKRLEEEAKAMIEDRTPAGVSDWRRQPKATAAASAVAETQPASTVAASEGPRKKTRRAGKKRKKAGAGAGAETVTGTASKTDGEAPGAPAVDTADPNTQDGLPARAAEPARKRRRKRGKKTKAGSGGLAGSPGDGEAPSAVAEVSVATPASNAGPVVARAMAGQAENAEENPGRPEVATVTLPVKKPKKTKRKRDAMLTKRADLPAEAQKKLTTARLKSFGLA